MKNQYGTGGIRMRLKLERVDAYYTGRTSYQYGVFDEVTGNCVGTIKVDRYIGKRRVARTVLLFDRCIAVASTPTGNASPS
jgi:hypothetical protein